MPVELELTLPLEEAVEPTEAPSALESRLLRTSVTRVQLLRLAMRGLHASEAAKILGIHPSTARTHYSDPTFRKEVMNRVDGAFVGTDAAFIERTKTLTERLEEQASKSFEDLISMLKPETNEGMRISDNLKAKIHLSFLDRVQDTAQVNKNFHVMDPIQLQHAAAAAREMDNVIPITKRKELLP